MIIDYWFTQESAGVILLPQAMPVLLGTSCVAREGDIALLREWYAEVLDIDKSGSEENAHGAKFNSAGRHVGDSETRWTTPSIPPDSCTTPIWNL